MITLAHGWGLSCNCIVHSFFLSAQSCLSQFLTGVSLKCTPSAPSTVSLAKELAKTWGKFSHILLRFLFYSNRSLSPRPRWTFNANWPLSLELWCILPLTSELPFSACSIPWPHVWPRTHALGESLGGCAASPLSVITALDWSLLSVYNTCFAYFVQVLSFKTLCPFFYSRQLSLILVIPYWPKLGIL